MHSLFNELQKQAFCILRLGSKITMPQWPMPFQGATRVWGSFITCGQGVVGTSHSNSHSARVLSEEVTLEMAKRKGEPWSGLALLLPQWPLCPYQNGLFIGPFWRIVLKAQPPLNQHQQTFNYEFTWHMAAQCVLGAGRGRMEKICFALQYFLSDSLGLLSQDQL